MAAKDEVNEALISSIRERYGRVLAKVGEAAVRSGRVAPAVRVVVVSKLQPVELLRAAVVAGVSIFGENYAEEAVEKMAALKGTAVEWHMIGHVQSRKANLVAEHFTMLHSLDSLKLAARLERFCSGMNRKLPVLLEFNVSGEESKSGFPAWDEPRWPDLLGEVEKILALPHLQVRGLMTMPPLFDDAERTRPYFQRLRRLQEFLAKRFPAADWSELSMGTSADYLAAVQEGATFVRIGQAVLGPRPK
jgi:PLP dependent protein